MGMSHLLTLSLMGLGILGFHTGVNYKSQVNPILVIQSNCILCAALMGFLKLE